MMYAGDLSFVLSYKNFNALIAQGEGHVTFTNEKGEAVKVFHAQVERGVYWDMETNHTVACQSGWMGAIALADTDVNFMEAVKGGMVDGSSKLERCQLENGYLSLDAVEFDLTQMADEDDPLWETLELDH